ncbi:MAG: transcriptional regulator [gamma proteobacterium symbiont of Stewartia floridana]|nr:MAG: transcriptional regulator [gamma proteobacterium symbiont of Stewartia floridana]RLW57974.1 MAG: transcriptional regulator [gamma proteobacterium symbiont of Stewartia floridana]
MKPFKFSKQQELPQYGEVIERIEILRSRLRLSKSLDQEGVTQILDELKSLRSKILLLSRSKQLDESKDADDSQESVVKKSTSKRKQQSNYAELGFQGVLGESPGLLTALEIVRRAAPTDLPILIEGESGTGKELFAKVIHANGLRNDQPFISINCGAIPENLIESELFGHKKGAFTGATADRKGHFESADGGTIFLDEVGELPLVGQVKLLRVLQSRELQRVGSDQVVSVDVRVVAATNRDLAQMARDGTFREDLYYRLGVIHATLPPLRERKDEIPLLYDFFAREAAENLKREPIRISKGLSQFLDDYHYPGNIREMRNLIYRISCLADDVADIQHLPSVVLQDHDEQPAQAVSEIDGTMPLNQVKKIAGNEAEKEFLRQGLMRTQGSVVNLAKELDINRSYLQTLLKKHGIKSKSFKP